MRVFRSLELIKDSISNIHSLRFSVYDEEAKEQIRLILRELERLIDMIR